MTALAAPVGFEPVFNRSGNVIPEGYPEGIASGYATSLYKGTPIKFDTNGNIVIAGSSGVIDGVFIGCNYKNASDLVVTFRNNWVASTTYQTGTMTAFIITDPEVIYRVQSAGSVAMTAIGDQADTTNVTLGNDYTGLSTSSLSTTLAGAGSTKAWTIMELEPTVDNAWGDAFTVVRVKLNQAQMGPASVVAI